MPDIVLYTAVSKGYDDLKAPPENWIIGANCVAFSDDSLLAPPWENRPLHREFSDPCRNAKIHKILPHIYFPHAEFSVWLDGSVKVTAEIGLREFIASHLSGCDLAVFRHRRRRCVYQEAAICIAKGKDFADTINRQMLKYRTEGYPEGAGLAECTILIRRHSERIRTFNEMWYAEIMNHSRRDQLSFNYVAHRLGLKFEYIAGTIKDNPYFKRLPHKQRGRSQYV